MATVTGFTSARMLAIENNSIVGGSISGDNLLLTKKDGTNIIAGNVRGPQGDNVGTASIVPSGSTLALRTATGQVKTATPTSTDDAASKAYVDTTDFIGVNAGKAYSANSVSLATSTNVIVPFVSIARNYGVSLNAGNMTQMVIAEAGTYRIDVRSTWSANATGVRQSVLMQNGLVVQETYSRFQATVVTSGSDTFWGGEIQCAAGDILQVQLFQSSGTTLTYSYCTLTVRRVAL